jgi:hypothetical protein
MDQLLLIFQITEEDFCEDSLMVSQPTQIGLQEQIVEMEQLVTMLEQSKQTSLRVTTIRPQLLPSLLLEVVVFLAEMDFLHPQQL